jgi:hypothetical protein
LIPYITVFWYWGWKRGAAKVALIKLEDLPVQITSVRVISTEGLSLREWPGNICEKYILVVCLQQGVTVLYYLYSKINAEKVVMYDVSCTKVALSRCNWTLLESVNS